MNIKEMELILKEKLGSSNFNYFITSPLKKFRRFSKFHTMIASKAMKGDSEYKVDLYSQDKIEIINDNLCKIGKIYVDVYKQAMVNYDLYAYNHHIKLSELIYIFKKKKEFIVDYLSYTGSDYASDMTEIEVLKTLSLYAYGARYTTPYVMFEDTTFLKHLKLEKYFNFIGELSKNDVANLGSFKWSEHLAPFIYLLWIKYDMSTDFTTWNLKNFKYYMFKYSDIFMNQSKGVMKIMVFLEYLNKEIDLYNIEPLEYKLKDLDLLPDEDADELFYRLMDLDGLEINWARKLLIDIANTGKISNSFNSYIWDKVLFDDNNREFVVSLLAYDEFPSAILSGINYYNHSRIKINILKLFNYDDRLKMLYKILNMSPDITKEEFLSKLDDGNYKKIMVNSQKLIREFGDNKLKDFLSLIFIKTDTTDNNETAIEKDFNSIDLYDLYEENDYIYDNQEFNNLLKNNGKNLYLLYIKNFMKKKNVKKVSKRTALVIDNIVYNYLLKKNPKKKDFKNDLVQDLWDKYNGIVTSRQIKKSKLTLKDYLLDYLEENNINFLDYFDLKKIDEDFPSNLDDEKDIINRDYLNILMKEFSNKSNIKYVIQDRTDHYQRLTMDLPEKVFTVYLGNDNKVKSAYYDYIPEKLESVYDNYINKIGHKHPVKKGKLTLGWVRYQLDEKNKSIFINEIQTDLTKVLGFEAGYANHINAQAILAGLYGLDDTEAKELKKQSNELNGFLSHLLLKFFIYYRDKNLKGNEIVLPSANLRKKLVGGEPSENTYDNNARKLRMKKKSYNDTKWDLIKDESGKVYVKNFFDYLLESYDI